MQRRSNLRDVRQLREARQGADYLCGNASLTV
jgi:hypothetical protein